MRRSPSRARRRARPGRPRRRRGSRPTRACPRDQSQAVPASELAARRGPRKAALSSSSSSISGCSRAEANSSSSVALLQAAPWRVARAACSSISRSRLQIALWLGAATPTRLPCGEQVDDELRAGVGLARAGRPLDEQVAVVESAGDRERARRGRGGPPAVGAGRGTAELRGSSRARMSRAARYGAVAVDPLVDDGLGELAQRRALVGVSYGPPGISARGSGRSLHRGPDPERELPVSLVELEHVPVVDAPRIRQPVSGSRSALNGSRNSPAPSLCSCEGKRQSLCEDCGAPADRDRVAVGLEPADRLGVELGQLLLGALEPVEELPADGLVLAAVVVEQLGHQPERHAAASVSSAGSSSSGRSAPERVLERGDLLVALLRASSVASISPTGRQGISARTRRSPRRGARAASRAAAGRDAVLARCSARSSRAAPASPVSSHSSNLRIESSPSVTDASRSGM